jgi:phenylalanyl-tRNA synthetase alpha chain
MEPKIGHRHPISQLIAEFAIIFDELGFTYAEGPERELASYNFDKLNVPKDHPSRDMQDTFYLDGRDDLVLRTHTSPVQVRYMEAHTPPIRMICPGKVFRNEATDATHEAQFHQLEGLVVDEEASLAHLKGVLEHFFSRLFSGVVAVRFRPSFFPFVEPGVEVDMKIAPEEGNNLSGRWIEIMGAGMVHPNVLRAAGVDPKRYRGYAFGLGVDRLAALRFGINDVRHFYSGDLRVVNQF